jgi:putative heme degradation protein
MLQKLADHIANCLACAAEAEQRAADATNETTRADNEKLARTWRHLASSYQFVQSLERFLLDAKEDKGARGALVLITGEPR